MASEALGSSFTWNVGWRLSLLLALGGAASWAARQPQTIATLTVLVLLMALLFADVLKVVRRTNEEVTRLVGALRHRDFSQRFVSPVEGSGFPELGTALEGLMADLRVDRVGLEATTRQLTGLIEQVPIPLLTIDDDENVSLLNEAARRLFDRPQGQRLNDFTVYGEDFVAELRRSRASQVLRLNPTDDAVVRLRKTETQTTHLGRVQRLVALQPIQSDLDASEQALAGGLVRVLTHELMNSLTPVTSLARSAVSLAATLPAEGVSGELKEALETVERRADGLLQFVARYRVVTGAPSLSRRPFEVGALFHDLEALFRAEWPNGVTFKREAVDVTLTADRQLLEHVLINLLRNAAQACVGVSAHPTVHLTARTAHSGRVLIDVEDDGPGIAPELREEVFLPFFTTRPKGSGIGLSLARQVVIAHGGSIRVETSALGGACLRLVL